MKATDIRRGHVIMIDGQPCRVMDFTHRTPGNLRAFVQVRFRNLVTGNTFRYLVIGDHRYWTAPGWTVLNRAREADVVGKYGPPGPAWRE
jgi:translation elongation factor P/translation initiation factor 5A